MISVHETEKVKFGRDREVPSGREASALPGQPTRRDLWLDRALAMPAGALAVGPTGAGLQRRYVGKMTGLGRAELTRLVGRHLATGQVRSKGTGRHHFPDAIRPRTWSFWRRSMKLMRA